MEEESPPRAKVHSTRAGAAAVAKPPSVYELVGGGRLGTLTSQIVVTGGGMNCGTTACVTIRVEGANG
jgi:hypothetical protein